MIIENFELDEQYFTSVQEKTVRKFIILETGEEMEGTFTGSKDRLEFSKLRGYGDTPGKAADDAYARYLEDKEFYISDSWDWK